MLRILRIPLQLFSLPSPPFLCLSIFPGDHTLCLALSLSHTHTHTHTHTRSSHNFLPLQIPVSHTLLVLWEPQHLKKDKGQRQ